MNDDTALNILIVEDEILIADAIERKLNKFDYNTVGSAGNYSEARSKIETLKPNLILIDIDLNDTKNGIDVANYINETCKCPFIFLTSQLDKHTLSQAKLTKPNGYLTKPINFSNLMAMIEMSSAHIKHNGIPCDDDYIIIKENKLNTKVNLREICFIKSDHVYIEIHTKGKKIITRNTITSILNSLPKTNFMQIHKSYVVNIFAVEEYSFYNVKVNGEKIPIGRKYYTQLKEQLQAKTQ